MLTALYDACTRRSVQRAELVVANPAFNSSSRCTSAINPLQARGQLAHSSVPQDLRLKGIRSFANSLPPAQGETVSTGCPSTSYSTSGRAVVPGACALRWHGKASSTSSYHLKKGVAVDSLTPPFPSGEASSDAGSGWPRAGSVRCDPRVLGGGAPGEAAVAARSAPARAAPPPSWPSRRPSCLGLFYFEHDGAQDGRVRVAQAVEDRQHLPLDVRLHHVQVLDRALAGRDHAAGLAGLLLQQINYLLQVGQEVAQVVGLVASQTGRVLDHRVHAAQLPEHQRDLVAVLALHHAQLGEVHLVTPRVCLQGRRRRGGRGPHLPLP
ncbi:hypothetical protein ON010_g12074 [Phytophthora cinnamomi]|nr:hypothetical protein ON010_g12074 [Phytophthora cinnamomi]